MQGFPDISDADRALLEAAVTAARAAADVHRRPAGPDAAESASEKGWADYVTEVDREAERRLVEVLRERFPHHAVLAEEDTPGEAGGEEVRWIVDPLDGTTNWIHGYPEHAVSIAAADRGGPRVAVVLNSATGELFEAVRGSGSRREGEPIRVSETAGLKSALVGTGFPFKKQEVLEPYLDLLGRVLSVTSGVRRGGSAALDLCDLACGRLDAFFELWLMPWDVAAGALIVREAGGRFGPLDLPWSPEEEPPAPGLDELRPGAFIGSNAALEAPFGDLVRGA